MQLQNTLQLHIWCSCSHSRKRTCLISCCQFASALVMADAFVFVRANKVLTYDTCASIVLATAAKREGASSSHTTQLFCCTFSWAILRKAVRLKHTSNALEHITKPVVVNMSVAAVQMRPGMPPPGFPGGPPPGWRPGMPPPQQGAPRPGFPGFPPQQ